MGDNMKGLKSYIVFGILFVSVSGTLLHFLYAWSGNNVIAGAVAPINESVWEHTKLLFFPMQLYAIYLRKKLHDLRPCISSGMAVGSILGVLSIISLFYIYTGILGFHIAFLDIAIFYVSVIIGFFAAYRLTQTCKAKPYNTALQIITAVLACLYILFSFWPPAIPLFQAP